MKSLLFVLFIASGRCVFAQSLAFVFLHHRTDKAELPKKRLDSIMDGHMANIQKMAKDGRLLVAGPFDGGGGIFIFSSSSLSEVKQWLNDDPGVRANRWTVEVQLCRWRIGQPRLAKEPFEMTEYHFIRFVPYIAKFNINDVPELLKKHDDYL
ncbi:MAG TPA: YciI family protein, partial [Cyclobacteriaceae bacterium]|nr:YciI family protein [Cyclobacteriaceae bacterium]